MLRGDYHLSSENNGGNIESHLSPPPTLQHDAKGETVVEPHGWKIKQMVAEIGSSKKRKQARVVGDESCPSEQPKELPESIPISRKPKQKKKIKLSFDEVDGN